MISFFSELFNLSMNRQHILLVITSIVILSIAGFLTVLIITRPTANVANPRVTPNTSSPRTVPTSPVSPPPVVPSAPVPSQSSQSATITFSADFANNGGCEPHNSRGCDIYTANIKLDGTVSSVTRHTTVDGSEAFPVFSADGKTVYANKSEGKVKGSIEWIDLATSTLGTLQTSARGFAPLPDGKSAVFSSLNDPNVLMMANFASPTSLTNAQQISPADGADYNEPHASPLGDIVFEKLTGGGRGSNTAQAGIYRSSTKEFLNLTAADGTGHCFWGFGGTSGFCNNSEKYPGIFKVPFVNGIVGTPALAIHAPKKADVIAQDSDFAECKTIYFAYGASCDATHTIVTMGCEISDADGTLSLSVSKLALVDISTTSSTIIPIGKNLAESFDGTGDSSYTVSCRMN